MGSFRSGGANQLGDCLQFRSEVKIRSFLFRFIFTNCFPHCVKKSIEKMDGESQSTVKSVNPHPMKIDVVKFNGTNNFGMWRCEVMDALTASNLEDTLRLKEKPEETSEKDWDRMTRMVCGLINDTIHQVSCAI